VDKEKIDELAADVGGLDYDDFVAFTTEALTGQGSESIYQLVDCANNRKKLFWKRKIPDTENSVRMGCFSLYRFFSNICLLEYLQENIQELLLALQSKCN
jgi:hypothetical protein